MANADYALASPDCESPRETHWRRVGYLELLRDAFRLDFGCESSLDADIQEGRSEGSRVGAPLGPSCDMCTEDHIREAYPSKSPEKVDAIILVLKLGLCLSAYGQEATHVEDIMHKCSVVLGVALNTVNVLPRELQANFHGCSVVHQLKATEGVVCDKASDVFNLCLRIESGEIIDARWCCELLDHIMERQPAHGWLSVRIAWFLFPGFGSIVFGGDVLDACVALLISAILVLLEIICSYDITTLTTGLYNVLVPITVGVCAPLISGRWLRRDACHYPSIVIGLHLLHVPGVQLIRAAYEVLRGNRMAGGARMVAAVITEMFLAMALTLGWQFFATDDDYRTVPTPWIVPTSYCDPPPFNWWQLELVLVGLVVNMSVILSVRLGELPLLIVLGWIFLGTTLRLCKVFPKFPAYPIIAVGAFFASFVAMARQYFTRKTWFVPVTVTASLLAPGASALLATLKGFDMQGVVSAWFDMLMMGVSWAFGLHLAELLWNSALQRQMTRRVLESVDRSKFDSEQAAAHAYEMKRRADYRSLTSALAKGNSPILMRGDASPSMRFLAQDTSSSLPS